MRASVRTSQRKNMATFHYKQTIMEDNKKIDSAAVAAISMAMAAYMGDNVHDNESGVLTITYVNKHWNNLNR